MTTIRPRTCRSCGISFPGGPRAWYCPACRAERRKESDRKMRQKKKTLDYIPIGSVISCRICGKKMIKNNGRHFYCQECAASHLKEIDNAQSLEWKRRNPDKIRYSNNKISRQRIKEGEMLYSGIKGITWDKSTKRWRVFPYINGTQKYIGKYKDLEDAKNALEDFMNSQERKEKK